MSTSQSHELHGEGVLRSGRGMLKSFMTVLLTCVLLLGMQQPTSAQDTMPDAPVTDDQLTGRWKAKGRFGPDARGVLILEKIGSSYIADMAGRRLPVHIENGELVFDLPDRQGSFRGKSEGKDILGHWFRPGSPVNMHGGGADSPVALSPVLLRSDGVNRWRGIVAPLVDEFTFYLVVTKRPDGSLGAMLRNPERDFGNLLGVSQLTHTDNVLKLIGRRRGQEKDQEVSRGTYDSENQVIRLVFPYRGGSYDFSRDTDESLFYPRGKHPQPYAYSVPAAVDDGWPVAHLDDVDIDRTVVERFVQHLVDMPMDPPDALQIHGLLIARHGKLVLEEYFHGESRDRLHPTRSAAKSVTAILAGAVMQAGFPLELASPVYQVMNEGSFPAGLDPQKRNMTLEHLLTTSAGFFCDDTNDQAPGNEDKMQGQGDEPDFYRYTLKVPLVTQPGERSVYCSANSNLALGMVGRVTAENPAYSFDRLVAGPMKISNYSWPMDPAGNPYGGGGTQFVLRDFMKFGQLILNGGTWDGRRILSESFATRASAPLYNLRGIHYGYLWWSEAIPYKDRTVRAVMALGAGGQIVTVVPELDLVTATFSAHYASRSNLDIKLSVPQFIFPAVRERGDDRTSPAIEWKYKSPYGPSEDGSRVSEAN